MKQRSDYVREELGTAPLGHVWITVLIQPSIDEMMKAWANPDAVVDSTRHAAMARCLDNKVVQVWASGHHVGFTAWLRIDHRIPDAQKAIDHGKLEMVSNPSGGNGWFERQWLEGVSKPEPPHSAETDWPA